MPLAKPAIELIVRGWFVGRLLGMVTDPTETSGSTVRSVLKGSPVVAALPWPVLRHGQQPQLHKRQYRLEWLPAYLEHVGMAMMLLSQDEHALDGYEELYRIGEDYRDHISSLIVDGVTLAGTEAQVVGASPDERNADFLAAVDEITTTISDADADAKRNLVADYSLFRKVPFGHELFPMFNAQLGEIRREIETTKVEEPVRG